MKTRVAILLTLALAALLRWWLGLTNPMTGIDDANIYFVYVRNLVEGHGFVYIPGGERVEGFTSMLWVLILSLIYLIRFLPFELTIFLLCFFITYRTLVVIYDYVREESGSANLALASIITVLLVPGFLDWNLFALMDTCLWIYAVVHGTILLIKTNRRNSDTRMLTLLCLLLPFIRPEGLFFAVGLGGLYLLSYWWNNKTSPHATDLPSLSWFMPLLFGILGIAVITGFRMVYFGYPVPNTFYAKVSMSLKGNIRQAFFYFYDSLRHTTLLPFILFGLTIVVLVWKKGILGVARDFKSVALILIILFFTAYPFLSGGDHFKYSRFFQTTYPLILILFIQATWSFWLNQKAVVRIALMTIGWVILNGNSTDETSFQMEGIPGTIKGYFKKWKPDILATSQLQGEFDIALNGRNIGRTLNKVFAPVDSFPSLGVTAAGGVAYTYKGHIVDVLGLNNLEMAHAEKIKTGVKNHGSFSTRIFFKQKPALFLTWPDPLTPEMKQDDPSAIDFDRRMKDTTGFINRICRNIFAEPQFQSNYQFAKIQYQDSHIYSYMDKNLEGYLEDHGLLVVLFK